MTAPLKIDIHAAIASLLGFTLDFQSNQEEISKLRSQYLAALDDSKQAITDKQQAITDRDAAITDDRQDEATIESLQKENAELKAQLAEQTAIADEATAGLTEILKRFALPVPIVAAPAVVDTSAEAVAEPVQEEVVNLKSTDGKIPEQEPVASPEEEVTTA